MQFTKAQAWDRSSKLRANKTTCRVYQQSSGKLVDRTYDCFKAFRSCLVGCGLRETMPMRDVPLFVCVGVPLSPGET